MRYLNLGCGGNRLHSPWENFDADVDITKPLPFPTGCAEWIFIEHCLEHVDSADGMKFLIEAHRVLATGGRIRICVPVLDRLEPAHIRDICTGHGHRQIYSESSLARFLIGAGFSDPKVADRSPIDGHWRVISVEKDDLETLRMEASK